MRSLRSRVLSVLTALAAGACGQDMPSDVPAEEPPTTSADAGLGELSLTTASNEVTPPSSAVKASTSDGTHVAALAVDKNFGTHWSGYGDGAWLRLDLGAVRTVSYAKIAVYNGSTRQNRFDLQVSSDGSSWTTVWSGSSSGTTTGRESYHFSDVSARYVRYRGHGCSRSMWNSISELEVFGPGDGAPPPTSGGCSYPSQILDLSSWYVTLPVGAPTTVEQPDLAGYKLDPYFRANGSCTAVQFRAHTSGATTSGSEYPRSELREMNADGVTKASWSTTSGTHTLFVDEAVTALPDGKRDIVAAQIHDWADDVLTIRVDGSKLYIKTHGGVVGPTLDANYTLGKRFTIKMVAGGGSIKIYYNGASTPAFTFARSTTGCYFKTGAYTQSNCSTEADRGETCGTDDYGEVEIHDLWVRHS